MLLILSLSASAFTYQISEKDTGWTTGKRRSADISFEISGTSLGVGYYHRSTDMDVNDVRMCEWVTANDGVLDADEHISLRSDASNPVESELVKLRGGQNYTLTVTEIFPVSLQATKSIDYVGRGIFDRESFGNNLDYVGASYLHTTDFRKDRACVLTLKNTWFQLVLNNTTSTILEDRFVPAKRVEYDLESYSEGLATLEYRQASDRNIVGGGEEDYSGAFSIERHISMKSPEKDLTDVEEMDWLECCLGGVNGATSENETRIEEYRQGVLCPDFLVDQG